MDNKIQFSSMRNGRRQIQIGIFSLREENNYTDIPTKSSIYIKS